MHRTLSISEWHQLAQNGNAPPVRIQLNGVSMFPLIRNQRDYVTVISLDKPLVIGDIVLLSEPGTGRYVMHRVWDLKDGSVLTWGDNCDGPDGWFPLDAIWGKVILIERGKKRITPDVSKGIRWARFWHHAGKGYRLYRRYREGLARRIKRLKA